jgi:sugar phosphate isomerase/epimerase
MKRRTFLQNSSIALGAAMLPKTLNAAHHGGGHRRSVHLFSKHLQFLDYDAMAEKAAAIGFDGVDLTVRPGGHVEPANATRDLPRAVKALRAHNLPPLMCTTAILSTDDPHFESTLDAIAESGIKHLRMGYYRPKPGTHPADRLKEIRQSLPPLVKALEKRGLNGGFQNHAGASHIGSSLWEYWQILQDVDPSVLGLQFDIRHAVAERGASWQNEFDIAAPKISSLVVKDFKWIEEEKTGLPELLNTPLDEGWVDFPRYFKMVDKAKLDVPISLHYEYALGGADKGRRELTIPHADVYAAMKRDLNTLRGW